MYTYSGSLTVQMSTKLGADQVNPSTPTPEQPIEASADPYLKNGTKVGRPDVKSAEKRPELRGVQEMTAVALPRTRVSPVTTENPLTSRVMPTGSLPRMP